MIRWASKSIVSEARLLADSLVGEIYGRANLIVRFPDYQVETRVQVVSNAKPNQILSAFLSTAPKAKHKTWVVATILFLKKQAGLKDEWTETQKLLDEVGGPRTRLAVIGATQRIVGTALRAGLAHVSPQMEERFFTLSISAIGAKLPRLARMLRGISVALERIRTRHATADSERLFDQFSHVDALCRAIKNTQEAIPVSFVGAMQSEYVASNDLDLVGLGAYSWRSDSGFEGLTTVLWDLNERRMLTWTSTRPTENARRQFDFALYESGATWAGAGTPDRLCRSRVRLSSPKLNENGRISTSQSTKGHGLKLADYSEITFDGREFDEWGQLEEYSRRLYPLGLRSISPNADWAILRPQEYTSVWYDELNQRLIWPVVDRNGDTLALAIPWNQVNEHAIEFLEAFKPAIHKPSGIVVRIAATATGLMVFPVSILSHGTPRGDQLLNIGLDQDRIESRQGYLLQSLRRKHGSVPRIESTLVDDDEWSDQLLAPPSAGIAPVVTLRLGEVDSILLQIAEIGTTHGPTLQDRLEQIAVRLERGGWSELAGCIQDLAQAADCPHRLLRARYVSRLHYEAIPLIDV